jgi:hypothetical protein
LVQREYSNLLIRFPIEHSPITRDDDVGEARHSALENAVIQLVVEDGQLSPGSYEFGQIRQKDRRSGKLLWAARELVCQYVQYLVDDLFEYAEVQLAVYDQVDSAFSLTTWNRQGGATTTSNPCATFAGLSAAWSYSVVPIATGATRQVVENTQTVF